MMKRYLWLLLILIASSSWAAQQTVTFPPDYKVRDRATKYNANFTELYRLAHDSYSSLQEYDDGDVVTSDHVLYVSLQDNNTGHPVTDPAWWQEVQVGGGVSTWLGLTDTPNSYTANYWVKVNSAGTGLELTTAPTGGGDMLLGMAQTITADKTYSDAAAAVFGTDGDWNISSSAAGQLDVVSNSAPDTTIDVVNRGSGVVNMTLHGKFTADAYASPQTSSGPQFTVFREDSDNGSNYVGWGSQASNNNDLVLLLPTADPTANQVLQFAAPTPVTFSDGVTRDASVGSWVSMGGGTTYVEQATDPSAGDESAGTWIFNTANGKGFFQSTTGLYEFAGTYTTNPAPTYTLDLTISGALSGDSITVNGTAYTASATISGLSDGVQTLTQAFGGTNDTVTWSGTDAGLVTGTPPNTQIDMSGANRSLTATFGAAVSTYEIEENFDGTGYQLTGWTETDNPDEDYTTSPAPLEGTESIYIIETGANSGITHSVDASQTKSVRFLFNPQTTNSDGYIFTFRRANGNDLCSVVMESSTNAVRVRNRQNISSSDTVGTMADGTTYAIWVDITAGDLCSVAFEEIIGGHATKPTSGANYTSVAITDTDDITNIKLLSSHANMAFIADDIKAASSPIGDL